MMGMEIGFWKENMLWNLTKPNFFVDNAYEFAAPCIRRKDGCGNKLFVRHPFPSSLLYLRTLILIRDGEFKARVHCKVARKAA